jgi:NodT family efflux transporter outer membrane factor (OMF) lipoprotein
MKCKNIIVAVAVGVAFSGLTSCNIYKKFEMPQDDSVTKEYSEVANTEADSAAFGNLVWQQVFTDPVLADLIQRALDNNVNLDNARLNVEVAKANVLGAKLSYLPAVALNFNGAGSKYKIDGASMSWTYTLPMAISWEVDVFGKTLNRKRAAEAALTLQEDYQQAVRSQIIGGVASCYYTIAVLESQLNLSRETAAIWKQSVQTMRDFKEAGRVTEAAVVQSEAQYYQILSSITDLETALDKANNAMSLLLNVEPQTWTVSADARLGNPQVLRDGIPMRELAMRPDVRIAEQQLAAAYYATNSARANFYPSLTISTNGGFTNIVGDVIMNPGKWFIQLAGQLTVPLFSRGQNIAALKGAKAQQEQAMNNFKYSLLNATAEIKDYLVEYDNLNRKSELLKLQTASLAQAVDMTNTLLAYDGQTTYLEVLNAQSSLLSAQMSALSTELERDQTVISLYQALGGGR